jgi:hypothetical protein
LVPQSEVLEHQGALGPDTKEETCEDHGDHAGHHRSGRPKVNVDEADGVNRRHNRYRSCPPVLSVNRSTASKPDHLIYTVSERTFGVRTEVGVGEWLQVGPAGNRVSGSAGRWDRCRRAGAARLVGADVRLH